MGGVFLEAFPQCRCSVDPQGEWSHGGWGRGAGQAQPCLGSDTSLPHPCLSHLVASSLPDGLAGPSPVTDGFCDPVRPGRTQQLPESGSERAAQ